MVDPKTTPLTTKEINEALPRAPGRSKSRLSVSAEQDELVEFKLYSEKVQNFRISTKC